VAAQRGELRVGDGRAELAHHRRLEHLAHLEHLLRFGHARLRDEGAARRLEGHEAVAAQLVQRLAHEGARNLEDVGDLLLGELGAGHQTALDDRRGDRVDDAASRRRGIGGRQMRT
jgi:hypothetical protein